MNRKSQFANRTHGVIGAVLAISAGFALTGCSPGPTACAGQCHAPYQLDVSFKSGTTEAQANLALAACAHQPTVISVKVIYLPADSGPHGRVYTAKFGLSAQTQPLLDCLDRRSVIEGAGWPD